MVMVDIENEEYQQAKKIIEKDRVKYPTLRGYVNLAIREKNKKEVREQ